VSPQGPLQERWRDAQSTPILDERYVEHIAADCTADTPPLSTEYIIAQLQQLRDVLPGELHDRD
jgi:hypothetical protein